MENIKYPHQIKGKMKTTNEIYESKKFWRINSLFHFENQKYEANEFGRLKSSEASQVMVFRYLIFNTQ